ARRHRGCRAHIPRRARYGLRYRPSFKIRTSKPETLPYVHHTAAQPRLHRIHRRFKLGGKLFAAPAVVIGQQHQLLPIRLETADAFQQALQLFRHLAPGQRIGRIGRDFHRGRLLLDRDFALLAHHVDRPVARDRRHPCNRRSERRIELSGVVPDLDVSLLNDLLREVLTAQHTEHDAEEFRARGGVNALKSRLIPLRNCGNQPDQLRWRQHSASPKTRDPPSRLTPEQSGSFVAYPAPKGPPSRRFRGIRKRKTRALQPGVSIVQPMGVRRQATPSRARIRPIESMSACSRALSSPRSRAWSRSSSSSTFFSSSNASLNRLLASSSWMRSSSAERVRFSRRWIAALA